MADKTITDLTASGPLDGLEIFHIVQSGNSRKTTLLEVLKAAAAGSATAPSISFAGDPVTGFYNPAANKIGFVTGSVQRLLLSNTAFQIDVPITGTAITQTATDTTAGRLLKVGDFGLGGTASPDLTNLNDFTTPTGVYRVNGTTVAGTTPPTTTVSDAVLVLRPSLNHQTQLYFNPNNNNGLTYIRKSNGAVSWGPWRLIYESKSLLGTVSQFGGLPTGAVIESGSNANGRYTKFASGLMECRQTMNAASGAAVTWTFPSAFIEGPVVTGNAIAVVLSALCLDAAPTTTAVTFSARDKTDARRADVVHLHAVGRWSTMV